MTTPNVPITILQPAEQQHMLLLFFPVRKGIAAPVAQETNTKLSAISGPDLRAATGVHFYMLYPVADGAPSTLPVPTFQTYPGKDMLVVLSIYDAPFTPYISAFTNIKVIADGLDNVLRAMDESGIVDPSDPTSAAFILANGGVFKNSSNFISLLLRYNFADPNIPATTGAAGVANPQADWKYYLGATFPGLTVGAILQNYPAAGELWPQPAVPITYVPAITSASAAAPTVPLVDQKLPVAAQPAAAASATAEGPVPETAPPLTTVYAK